MEGLALFKTPSIYLIIEGYLEWRDFLHIAQTCRELYYNWVSKYPIRWKDLKLPRFICESILGLKEIEKDNPTRCIRKRALKSLISNNVYLFPCMGRCGKRVYRQDLVSHELTYALCIECARLDRSCFLTPYLIKNKLTKDPEAYLTSYMTALIGAEKFTENKKTIFGLFNYGYVKSLRKDEWLIPVYSIRDVKRRAKHILTKISL